MINNIKHKIWERREIRKLWLDSDKECNRTPQWGAKHRSCLQALQLTVPCWRVRTIVGDCSGCVQVYTDASLILRLYVRSCCCLPSHKEKQITYGQFKTHLTCIRLHCRKTLEVPRENTRRCMQTQHRKTPGPAIHHRPSSRQHEIKWESDKIGKKRLEKKKHSYMTSLNQLQQPAAGGKLEVWFSKDEMKDGRSSGKEWGKVTVFYGIQKRAGERHANSKSSIHNETMTF